MSKQGTQLPGWTLVTSHGLVLLYVVTNPETTIREAAAALELTERRVADVIRDLTVEGLLIVKRTGRRNRYALSPDARFRHPILADVPFIEFVFLAQRVAKSRHGGGQPLSDEDLDFLPWPLDQDPAH